ncbi:MAG: ABC transporter ATP-binding protein [Candidatus Dormibacteria bacterium]
MTAGGAFVAREVTGGYGRTPVVTAVSAQVATGEVVALVGPNGAGKSTFLKAVFGLLPMMEGRVTLGEEVLSGLEPQEIARRGVAYVPQVDNVFPTMTIHENLEMGAFATGTDFQAGSDYVYELFPDLLAARRRPAGQLSGGQRIMLALARGLMAQPSMILLDEPTAGLSPLYADRVWELIRRIASDNRGVLVVEQNVGLALRGSDRLEVLVDGRVKLTTTPHGISEERLAQVFLGLD